MTIRLLVTGFGPFPGATVNPAGPMARTVARIACQRDVDAMAVVLHTSYGEGLSALAATLDAVMPDAVLMIGLASRSREVRVERVARPGATALASDASGRRRARLPGGAAPIATTARTASALARLRRHGLRARLSLSAGRYLCNAAYAVALTWAHRDARVPPVLFVHIPRLVPLAGVLPSSRRCSPLPRRLALIRALATIAADITRQARQRNRKLNLAQAHPVARGLKSSPHVAGVVPHADTEPEPETP